MPPRARLSVGASRATKVITVVIALALAGLAFFTGLVAYGFAYGARENIGSTVNDGVWHRDENGKLVPGPSAEKLDTVGIVGGSVGALCALIFLFFAIYLILRTLRSGAWLSGSVLHVRGAMRTRSQDLATASVGGGQALTATDPKSGRKVTLTLKGRGEPKLPDEQLMMLANAITNTRVRSGPDDKAFAVAERLREIARDPLS